jgi:hypothetical protein
MSPTFSSAPVADLYRLPPQAVDRRDCRRRRTGDRDLLAGDLVGCSNFGIAAVALDGQLSITTLRPHRSAVPK